MKQPTPEYHITLDGRDLTSKIAPRLESLSLSEARADEADTLELRLDDSDGRLAIPAPGAVLSVSFGWSGTGVVDKGTFTIDEVAHDGAPDILTIRARSASMTKQMRERREKSWHRKTIGEIVRTIAARYALEPGVSDALKSIAIAHIDQTNESDMAFLSRLAKRYDAVMTVKHSNLLFMPIGQGMSVSGKPLESITLTRKSGDQHSYHTAQGDSCDGVRANYYTVGKAARSSVVIGENQKNVKVLPQTYANEADARAAATAEIKRSLRAQATMSYTLALGRPDLYPETPVQLSGFKPDIDELPWLAKKVSHRISSGGYTTALELEVRGDPPKSNKGSAASKKKK